MTASRRSVGAGRPASARRKPALGGESWASSPGVRQRMQRQQTRDTSAELAVRRILHRMGLRYRVDAAPLRYLRRRADLVFGPSKVAVFIDGCFWHGCPDHGSRATTANPGYWNDKISRNRARDADTDAVLAAAGWSVVRAWEHEDPAAVADTIFAEVSARRRPRMRSLSVKSAPSGDAFTAPIDRRVPPRGMSDNLPSVR